MAWFMDTYSMHVRRTTTAIVTGKPLSLGGSLGRTEATGRGVMIICREALKKLGLRPENTRVVVQGAGNVGGIGAMLMHREGYKIVSMSDMYSTIHEPKGLDVPAVLAWIKQHKRLTNYPDAEHIASNAQLELDCDVLVPAATENQITSANAERIKARLIVEGANGSTTALALPSDSSSVRSATFAMAGSCVATTTVFPSRASDCSSSITTLPDVLSRFPVGSSASSTGGLFASARAIATRCCSPPDRIPGSLSL
jgi:hypothetical protein